MKQLSILTFAGLGLLSASYSALTLTHTKATHHIHHTQHHMPHRVHHAKHTHKKLSAKRQHAQHKHLAHHPQKIVSIKHQKTVQKHPVISSQQKHDVINSQKPVLIEHSVQPASTHLQPPGTAISMSAMASQHIIAWVRQTALKLKYSHYRFGGSYFNSQHGVYEVDCSGYVNHVLGNAAPDAYHTVVSWSRSYKPTSEDYYLFFNKLPRNTQQDWHKIQHVSQLTSGDILVFRYKHFWKRKTSSGHVMVVVSKPVPVSRYSNTYYVQVADSALAGHSNDTRRPHTSGIGIGTLLIQENRISSSTCSYAWKVGAPWKKHVYVAMARPIYV